jgi:aldehyde dehydrogenase (NAD+)
VKMIPCLAMGNTCIIKPAEQTPLTALKIAEMLNEVGFPPGVINIIPGYGPTAGAALAHHMKIRKIAFTGSTDVGRLMLKASADSNLKQVQLELGGKSPLVIFDDADVDEAVEIAAYVFCNNGQVCDSCSRTFVHEKIYDEFVKRAVEKAKSLKIGNPTDPSTDIGPLVSEEQYQRVLGYLESAKREGANLAYGGRDLSKEEFNGKGYFVEPTVFSDVTPDMTIFKEEIFGPVQSIIKFNDMKQVIAQANNTSYGLAGGVVSKSMTNIFAVTKGVKAGTIWGNTYAICMPQFEFGGVKQSGFGREGGTTALNEWTELKTVCIKI